LLTASAGTTWKVPGVRHSARAMKDATETFAHLGVAVSGAALDFAQVQRNKDQIVKGLWAGSVACSRPTA
jgi:hypothetical protein